MADDGLVIKVSGDTKPLEESLKKVDKTASKVLKGMAVGITAFNTSVGIVVKNTAALGDRIDKMSQKIDISREAFQKWDFVLSQNGASIESLQGNMKFLSKAIDANDDSFKKLGITQKQLKESSPEQIFERVIAGLQNMDAGIGRNAIATKLLGRGYQELAPLLNQTAKSTEDLKKSFAESGAMIEDEQVNSAVEFTDALHKLQTVSQGSISILTSTLFPQLTRSLGDLTKYLAGNKQKLSEFGDSITSFVTSTGRALKGAFDIFNSLPDYVKGPAGIGIIGAIFLGPKAAAVIAALALTVKVLQDMNDAAEKASYGFNVSSASAEQMKNRVIELEKEISGLIGKFKEAAEDPELFESLGRDIADKTILIKRLQEEIGKIAEPSKSGEKPDTKPPSGGDFGAEGAKKAADAIRDINKAIEGLKPETYTRALSQGLDEIRQKAEGAGLSSAQLAEKTKEYTEEFSKARAIEADKLFSTIAKEIATLNGEFKKASDIELQLKLADIRTELERLIPFPKKVEEAFKAMSAEIIKATQASNAQNLLERQISALERFKNSVPEVDVALRNLQAQLIDLQLVQVKELFADQPAILAQIDEISKRMKLLSSGTFEGGFKGAFASFKAEWADFAKDGEKVFNTIQSAFSEAMGMAFDAIFDGAEFRADKLLKNIGKQLAQMAMNKAFMSLFTFMGFHEGGAVPGDSSFSRQVEIPKFHNGLLSDEFMAILQKGEVVLTQKQQQTAVGMMGGQSPVVNVYNENYSSGAKVESKQTVSSSGEVEIRTIITDTVSQNIANGGSIDTAISGSYAIKRIPYTR